MVDLQLPFQAFFFVLFLGPPQAVIGWRRAGLADPYVRGHLGRCRFQTNIQRKTLTPRWLEEFKIPIISWEEAVLRLEVRDKDYIFDDSMGYASPNSVYK